MHPRALPIRVAIVACLVFGGAAACSGLLGIEDRFFDVLPADGSALQEGGNARDAGIEAGPACSPAPWSVRAGGVLAQSANALAVGPKGDVIVAGAFAGTLDLGTGSITSPSSGAAGAPALFVAKLDALGQGIWTRAVVPETAVLVDGGWSASAYAADVALDAEGNVWVVGDIAGRVRTDDGGVESTGQDVLVMKLDAGGRILWTKIFGSDGDQSASAIVVNAQGHAFIGGANSGKIQFPDGRWTTSKPSAFTMGLDKDGETLWGKGYEGDDAGVTDMGLDPVSGRVVVTGRYQHHITLGGNTLSGGFLYRSTFLASLEPSTGEPTWSQKFQGNGDSEPHGLGVDARGNIVVTGSFDGTLDFGNGEFVAPSADVFIVKRDPNGGPLWSKQYGDDLGGRLQFGTSVAFDARGQVLVGGWFDGTLNFGDAGSLTGDGANIFLAFFTSSGDLVWRRRFGNDALQDLVLGLAFDPCGNPLMAGTFAGALDTEPPLTAADGDDLFVVRLAPRP